MKKFKASYKPGHIRMASDEDLGLDVPESSNVVVPNSGQGAFHTSDPAFRQFTTSTGARGVSRAQSNDLLDINVQRAQNFRRIFRKNGGASTPAGQALAEELFGTLKGERLDHGLLGRDASQWLDQEYTPRIPSREQYNQQEKLRRRREQKERSDQSIAEGSGTDWINELKQKYQTQGTRGTGLEDEESRQYQLHRNIKRLQQEAFGENEGWDKSRTSVSLGELLTRPELKIKDETGRTREIGKTDTKGTARSFISRPAVSLGRASAVVQNRLLPDLFEQAASHPVLKEAARTGRWTDETHQILHGMISDFRDKHFELHHGQGLTINHSTGQDTEVPSVRVNNELGDFADRVGSRLEPRDPEAHEEMSRAFHNLTADPSLRTIFTRYNTDLGKLTDVSRVKDIYKSGDSALIRAFETAYPDRRHPFAAPINHDVKFMENWLEFHHNGGWGENKAEESTSTEPTLNLDDFGPSEGTPTVSETKPKGVSAPAVRVRSNPSMAREVQERSFPTLRRPEAPKEEFQAPRDESGKVIIPTDEAGSPIFKPNTPESVLVNWHKRNQGK